MTFKSSLVKHVLSSATDCDTMRTMPGGLFAGSVLLVALFVAVGCAPFMNSTRGERTVQARHSVELNSGWICMNIADVHTSGEDLSRPSLSLHGWLPATVPGTILTTLLNNNRIPDPLYGMNNRQIPDIYVTGKAFYTYWFVNDINWARPTGDNQAWLRLRGVNYSYDLFLNGHKLNDKREYGMFLRHRYNVTPFLSSDGRNRVAVLVSPPDSVGNPNGGQGGDGMIGHNVANQYVAGWDWIQPVADRNTGIWDKVTLEETGSVALSDPNIVTFVPGKRLPGQPQAPAVVRASAELTNSTDRLVKGTLQVTLGGKTVSREAEIQPRSTVEVQVPDCPVENPRLWWPNGYGPQDLYETEFRFVGTNGAVIDEGHLSIGIREIQTAWNSRTQSAEVRVNGQPIFIKGGNWITSDAMLRVSPERYETEVRFHHDMNLNLIRVWGGGITERPEFYDACDRYGLLVFQDLWISGDCNGKWYDPMKKEDQWTRRAYPDDHDLFLRSVADQVRMLRHHPSLAFYCGGNEMPPSQDLLAAIQDSLLPLLDSSRTFFPFSNAENMSHNSIGGNGDGPYRIQPITRFWEYRSFPFNSEIGSVGMGDVESLERFIPPANLVIPLENRNIDSVWRYHKYSGYGVQMDAYGTSGALRDFAEKAQLLNYDQYRGLMEGHYAHMWDWYTGIIIWKTQNPWTALRGAMYDWYLDPNAALYGLRQANEPVHIMCSPLDGMLLVVNHTFRPYHDLMAQAKVFDIAGRDTLVFQWIVEVGASSVQKLESVQRGLATTLPREGGFLSLRLLDRSKEVLSENLYWLPDTAGNYTGLQRMPEARIAAFARKVQDGKIEVRIDNPASGPLAFFQRLALINKVTGKRLLPVTYSANYLSLLPGGAVTVTLGYPPAVDINTAALSIRGWNVPERRLDIQNTNSTVPH